MLKILLWCSLMLGSGGVLEVTWQSDFWYFRDVISKKQLMLKEMILE